MSVANSEELNLIPWDSRSIRRETTSVDCPLSSIKCHGTHMYACTHMDACIQTQIKRYSKNFKGKNIFETYINSYIKFYLK